MKTLYLDMDGVLVDIVNSCEAKYGKAVEKSISNLLDTDSELFLQADPMPGAIEAYNKLAAKFEVYILTTVPWNNLDAFKAKRLWVEKHLGQPAYKRVITCHHKNLLRGDYLIDDRTVNGAQEFTGKFIQFGTEEFPDWDSVLSYLL
jgi:5'-nucleotidase